MLKRIVYISIFMLVVLQGTTSAQSLKMYEYWFDEDYNNKTIVYSDNEDINLQIDINALSSGLHYYNFRALNSDEKYSSLYRYIIYIPEDAEPTGTSLVGYKYSFNNISTYVPIPEKEQYELLSYDIPLPDILDVATIGDGCTFSFADKQVSMARSTEVNFDIQFVNQAGKWSIPETYSYSEEDQLEKEYIDLAMDNTISIVKVAQGDFHAVKMLIPTSGTYYLCSNQSCKVDIYKADGTLLVSVTPQELSEIYALAISAGTYYGIVYNTIENEDNKSGNVKLKLSTKDDGINDDIEGLEDTDITLFDNIMYMENERIVQGCSKTIPILLKNSANIIDFSFDMILPEGITVAKNNKGKNLITLDPSRKTDSHAITSTIMGDGTVSVKCISADEEILEGSSGIVVYVTLDVAENMERKDYAIALRNIKFTSDGDLGNTTELTKSTIKILRFVPGDVDMDEELTKADVDGIARCIINKNTEGLNIKAADANQDGIISINDAVFVVQKLLEK